MALSKILDKLSNFFAAKKGLLPIIGICLVLINFVISQISSGWWAQSDIFLHFGIIIAIFGFMLAWAL
ncbi:MAG: hypothetical protein CVU39_02495 [Chloroflexi bacterium HGW-Chloroflexi-10]|nr:MAG: hypothetical protein CVU39_02495 [Chloroflexi bacterium HGW-Chloroflexi-10]